MKVGTPMMSPVCVVMSASEIPPEITSIGDAAIVPAIPRTCLESAPFGE